VKLTEPPRKLRKWKKRAKKRQFRVSIPNTRGEITYVDPPLHLFHYDWRARSSVKPGCLCACRVRNFMNKGSRDLMRGGQAAVLGTLPTALAYFSVYEATREVLQRILPEQPAQVHLSSAAAGALASSVFRVPGDSVRHQVTKPLRPFVPATTSCRSVPAPQEHPENLTLSPDQCRCKHTSTRTPAPL
jgi:hypothetical protein